MTPSPAHRSDVFGQAEQTAHEWLSAVAASLVTEDEHHAHRVVRAWLHTVRDRLPVAAAASFAAQLPVVWRGVFYDGWQPQQVPVKHDVDEFLSAVARDAGVSVEEARRAAAVVTAALARLTSADHIGHLLAQFPRPLREALEPGGPPPARAAEREPHPEPTGLPVTERVDRLEGDLQILAEALGALVEALDERPSSEPEPSRYAAGARRAHQLLLSRAATG